MSASVKQYTVLISAPSDIKDEISIVKKCFDKFNRGEGKRNNINLITQYWKEDSYPEQGDKPQNILNRQIVDECDAIIAIFGTRFGTPTESYGSGTEEEITRLRDSEKQVFLYFSEVQVDAYSLDLEQFNKVKDFKARVQSEGLHGGYKKLEEFEEDLSNHLSKYFLNFSPTSKNNELKSNLYVNCFDGKEKTEKLLFFQTDMYNQIGNKKIMDLVERIKTIQLVKSQKSPVVSASPRIQQIMASMGTMHGNQTSVTLDAESINVIRDFFRINSITYESDFFDVGNLTEPQVKLNYSVFGGRYSSLKGTESEVEKYKLLNKLYDEIVTRASLVGYFKQIDDFYILTGIVGNNGQNIDDDIDITLFIPKGRVVNVNQIPIPEEPCIELFSQGIVQQLLKPESNHLIQEYPDYLELPRINMPIIPNPFSSKSSKERYEEKCSEYKDWLKDLFIYEYHTDESYDIIRFNISHLKHHCDVFFPSNLLFREKVQEIKYEIRSEKSPKVITGILN